MKLLLFSDTHGEKRLLDGVVDKAKKYAVDAVICAGDISWFGKNIGSSFKKLNKLGIPIFFVQGNHEVGEDIEKIVLENKNLYHIETNPVFFAGYLIVGFGGGGFFIREPKFEIKKRLFVNETIKLIIELASRGDIELVGNLDKISKLKTVKDKINLIKKQFKNKIIFVTHQPPYGCKCDYVYNGYVGNKDYSDLIKEFEPVLFVCGHIHETAGLKDKKAKTIIINPGWIGKIFKL